MSLYWDHAISRPDLLRVLKCLHPANNMKLDKLIDNAWHKVSIALLQRARNIQTIIEAIVYNRSRPRKLRLTTRRSHIIILEPCGSTLLQPILHAHLDNPPPALPTDKPTLTITQHPLPYEHDRCTLYESANVRRGTIIGCALFCPVCKIFNHTTKMRTILSDQLNRAYAYAYPLLNGHTPRIRKLISSQQRLFYALSGDT